MGLFDFFRGVKETKADDVVKTLVKDAKKSKAVKKVTAKAKKTVKAVEKKVNKAKAAVKNAKKVAKAASTLGIDAKTIATLITKHKDVIATLIKIGIKKESDAASASVQKLVGSLKNTISKALGTKISNDDLSKVVTKLLSNDKVKAKLNKESGSGVISFIKKAVAEYTS